MKNILFVTYDFPFPTNTGGKNRAYHMLKYSQGDFKKYLYSFVRHDFNVDNIHALEKIGVEVVGSELRRSTKDIRNAFSLITGKSIFKSLYFSMETFERLLKIIIEKKIDIVHFESFYTAFYMSSQIKNAGSAQIFGTENIEYKLYEEYTLKSVSPLLRPFFQNQVNKIKKSPIFILHQSPATDG